MNLPISPKRILKFMAKEKKVNPIIPFAQSGQKPTRTFIRTGEEILFKKNCSSLQPLVNLRMKFLVAKYRDQVWNEFHKYRTIMPPFTMEDRGEWASRVGRHGRG